LAATGHTIYVVQFRRAVQAETHAEALRCEEAAPFFVQQNAVGLDAVANAPASGLVLALELNSLAKEVHAQSGGLSSVPREVNLRPGCGLNVLDYVLFQQAVWHSEHAGIGIEAPLVPVVAVLAIEITDSPGWLDENLELPGNLPHYSSCKPRGTGRRPPCNPRTISDSRTPQFALAAFRTYVFDCYNIVSKEDLRQAMAKTQEHLRALPADKQKVVGLPRASEGGGH
jgi:hypothetical protein